MNEATMKRAVLFALALAPAGCAGFGPPTPEGLAAARLTPRWESPGVRLQARLRIASDWLSGEFEGVVVARTGARPELRAQLLPDIGGKALDLTASADRIAGWCPAARLGSDHRGPHGFHPDPMSILGVTLLEMVAETTPDRVRAEQRYGEGWWLELEPIVPGTDVQAHVLPDGRIARRYFEFQGARWWEERLPNGGFILTGPGVRVRADEVRITSIAAPGDALLYLELPADVLPFETGVR